MATEKNFIVGKGIEAQDVIESKSGGFKFPDESTQVTAIAAAANEVVTGNWEFAPAAGDVKLSIGGTSSTKGLNINDDFRLISFNPVPGTAPDVFEISYTGVNSSASAPNGHIGFSAPAVMIGVVNESSIYVYDDATVAKTSSNGIEISSSNNVINVNDSELKNLADPTAAQSAVTVQYLVSLFGANNGIAPLDNDGFIPSNYLPALSITETFVVADETARLALDAQKGDVAIQTDNSTTYILSGDDPTQTGDWTAITAPLGGVTSVTVAGTAGELESSGSPITSTGTITLSLANVANAGGGSFVKVARDGKGRVTGTSAVVAGDIIPLLETESVGALQTNANGTITTGNAGSTSSTSQTPIAQISATGFTVGKFLVSLLQGSNVHAVEILVAYDGTNVFITEYGQILTGSELATFDADVSGGNIRLLMTPASGTTMAYKVGITHLGDVQSTGV